MISNEHTRITFVFPVSNSLMYPLLFSLYLNPYVEHMLYHSVLCLLILHHLHESSSFFTLCPCPLLLSSIKEQTKVSFNKKTHSIALCFVSVVLSTLLFTNKCNKRLLLLLFSTFHRSYPRHSSPFHISSFISFPTHSKLSHFS